MNNAPLPEIALEAKGFAMCAHSMGAMLNDSLNLDVCPRSPTSYPVQGYSAVLFGTKTEIPVETIPSVNFI